MSVKLLTEVRHAEGLTGWPKALLLVLADLADPGRTCSHTRAELAAIAGCSIRTVSRALKALIAAGWIRIEPRNRPDGGRTASVVRFQAREARS